MTDRTLITPESGAIVIESCSIFNHPRIRGRYRSSHLRRLMPADHQPLRRGRSAVERHETPWNAGRPATLPVFSSPEFGQVNGSRTSNVAATFPPRFRHAASRGVTHHQGSVQALPWSCLVPIYSVLTDGSLRTHVMGGARALPDWSPSKTGRSPKFAHPQLAGRPYRLTSGGVATIGGGIFFQDRPLNSLSINVQKKGSWFAQKTQQKPTGFLGGSTC